MGILIDQDRCTLCGNCGAACPFGLIEITGDKVRVKEGCNLCGACREACAFDAILIEAADEVEVSGDYRGVWVFAEQRGGRIKRVAYELLSKGRELADALGTELAAICFGHNITGVDELSSCGADKVFLLDDPAFENFDEELYISKMVELVLEHKPEILLAGATAMGRSFMPRVAARLKTGLTADCTALEIDLQRRLLLQTRPTFGGNIMATIICQSRRPQMATVRPRVFKRKEVKGEGRIIKVDFRKEGVSSRTKLIGFIEDLGDRVRLEDSDIIVSGGRGLGKAENFKLLEELARVMGAALGSSRPPVDEGWIPYSHQVGQTGKTVCPKLYIACGISGAVQHLAGMQTSEVIVAINNDPNAPIFEVATYGIVGDLFEVVPLLISKLKGERA